MIDSLEWMNHLTQNLLAAFGRRLLFVGLQGSYQRGEATVQSDIDAVVLLEALHTRDLAQYRCILAEMPHSERACGFICGKQEFAHWPKHEIFRFCQDTQAFYGSLEQFAPHVTREDIRESLRVGAANLYHEACHGYLYGDGSAEILQGAYKSVFFLLQVWYYLAQGRYIQTRQELLRLLHGPEAELLEYIIHWEKQAQARKAAPERWFERLIDWSGSLLSELEQPESLVR